MNATCPTTRPAFPFDKLRARSLDPVTPRLGLLGGLNPAYPLIAREWRNILPCCSHRPARSKGLSQIHWHSMNHASGDIFYVIISHLALDSLDLGISKLNQI